MSNEDLAQPEQTTPPQASTPTKKSGGFSVSFGQILAGILLVLVIIFIVENTDDVKVRIIAGPKVNAPVYLYLLIAAVAGALIAGLMRLRRKHTAKIKAKAKANS